MAEVFPVADHDVGEELAGSGGRVSNGVGSRLDGAEDVLLPGAAGGDDGNGGELRPDFGYDLGGPGRAGDIEDVRPGGQPSGDVHIAGDDGGDHRDVHHRLHFGNGLIGDGGVDHHAGSPLVLRILCQADGAVPVGHAAAHAHKDRHLRHADDGLGDGGLGGKGIDRDDGVGIDVFDDGHVGGKDKGFDPPAKDPDAAALRDALGDGKQMAAQSAAVLRGKFCFHKMGPSYGRCSERPPASASGSSTSIILRFSSIG